MQPAVLHTGGCGSHGLLPLPCVTRHGHTFNCLLPAESTIHYADVPWILAAEEPQQAELQRVVLYGGGFAWPTGLVGVQQLRGCSKGGIQLPFVRAARVLTAGQRQGV